MYSTSSESQWLRVASYVYVFTVIREMSKVPCKKHFSGKKIKQMRGSCRKIALQIKNICRGAHHKIFATGPLVHCYATGH